MLRFAIIAALLLSGGCAASLKGATWGAPRDPDAPPAPATRDMPRAAQGPAPALLYVETADGVPAPGVDVLAKDAAERVYQVTTDARGEARLSVWSSALTSWKTRRSGGEWTQQAPARVRPADGGEGWRITLTLGGVE